MSWASSTSTSILNHAPSETRAIVLALQGLQEKVRHLEEDRNFHRKKCQEAHSAHETYKRSVEEQLDRERSEHRRREEAIQQLLEAALTEKRRLESSSLAQAADLQAFRESLSKINNEERVASESRERELRSELEVLRSEIVDLRSFHEKLSQTIAQLKGERELVLSTNKRLEMTVSDLITMNESLVRGGPQRSSSRTGGRSHSLERSRSNKKAFVPLKRSFLQPKSSSDSAAFATNQSSTCRSSYFDPTVSSLARTVERVRSESPQGGRRPFVSPLRRSRSSSAGAPIALETIYDELKDEHGRLVEAYKFAIERESVSQNELNDLVSAIDQKAEQMRLMRLAGSVDSLSDVRGLRQPSPRGTHKAAQRGALVAQLRNMIVN